MILAFAVRPELGKQCMQRSERCDNAPKVIVVDFAIVTLCDCGSVNE